MVQRPIAYHYACHVDAGIGFHTARTGAFSFFPPESVTFDYEGQEFQWNEWGSDYYVTVALVSPSEIDRDHAHGLLLGFLSALSFATEAPIRFISFGGGMPASPDRRVAFIRARALASAHTAAPISTCRRPTPSRSQREQLLSGVSVGAKRLLGTPSSRSGKRWSVCLRTTRLR